MKKFISIILVFALLISVSVPAFASTEHNPEECKHTPVIVVRGMDFGGLYVVGENFFVAIHDYTALGRYNLFFDVFFSGNLAAVLLIDNLQVHQTPGDG